MVLAAEVGPAGLDQALWVERGAEISVTSQGVARADLLRFVAELRAIVAGTPGDGAGTR